MNSLGNTTARMPDRATRCVAHVLAYAAGLLFVLGLIPDACAQEVQEPRAESRESAQAERRAAFVLPDVVVAGEDQSRLRGGVRLLEAEIPGVIPHQKPLLMEPGPTRYRRRIGLPFEVRFPAPEPLQRVRWLVRAAAGEGPTGTVSCLMIPSVSGASLFWGHLRGWEDRIPGRGHGEADLGWRMANHAQLPSVRGGVDIRADRETWDVSGQDGRDGEMQLFYAAAFVERRLRAAGSPSVLSVRVATGTARTEYQAVDEGDGTRRMRDGSAAAEKVSRGSWADLELGLSSAGGPRDLCERPERSGLGADLWGAYAHRDGPDDSAQGTGRWRGSLVWRTEGFAGTLALGVSGGGEGASQRHQLVAPRIAFRKTWRAEGLFLLAEISPEISFFEEVTTVGGGFAPEISCCAAARPCFCPETVRFGHAPLRFGRGLRSLEVSSPSIIDPVLPPQKAWPRVACSLLRKQGRAELELEVEIAKLRDPFDWRAVPGTCAPVLYATASSPPRWLALLGANVDWPVTGGVDIHLRYRWSQETAAGHGSRALLFFPEHEITSAIEMQAGMFLWRLSAHGRSRSEAGGDQDPTRAFLSCAGTFGVRFGNTRVSLVVENLLNEEIEYRPDETFAGRWFGIEWNHTFVESVP